MLVLIKVLHDVFSYEPFLLNVLSKSKRIEVYKCVSICNGLLANCYILHLSSVKEKP